MTSEKATSIYTRCSKEEYREKLAKSDYELAYYLHIDHGVPYLRADIEYGGNIGLRVELFSEIYSDGFRLINSELSIDEYISVLVADCRGYHAGGITFIEYDNRDEAEEKVVDDFIDAHDEDVTPIYMINCSENALRRICVLYPNEDVYLLMEEL